MAILNYTTKIDHHNTIGEISKILVRHGCTKITVRLWQRRRTGGGYICHAKKGASGIYSLPARWEGVLSAMTKQKVPKGLLTKEQAIRVAWRNILTWVAAQMAMVEAEQCEVQEIFLPYLMLKSGRTLYDEVKAGTDNIKLLN